MATSAELAGATSADIETARTTLVTFLQERFPALSLRAGQLADLVLGPTADGLAAVDAASAAAQASMNPEAALAAGGYDSDVLDTVLAGRGVYRRAASTASGTLGLKFSDNTYRTITAGMLFETVDGIQFKPSSGIRILPTGSIATSTSETVLVADPAGAYIATVAITAVESGASGNRPAGTSVTSVDTITSLTSAWIASDLSGGADAETDAALLARLPAASAARTAGSADGATAILEDAVPTVSAAASIGFGHEAMYRGRSVLGGQSPGRADLRFRTASAPSRLRLSVTATLIDAGGPYGIWRFTLDRDAAPGLFLVEKILQTNSALTDTGYAPTTSFGYDITGYDDPPDVRSVADAAHSRFATATVQFTDPDTSLSGKTVNVSTKTYSAVVRVVEGAGDGQDAMDVAGARAFGGDCLVRAAVPVRVSVTVEATAATGVTVTAAEVAAAVAAGINAQGISPTLSGARVAATAAATLPAGTALTLSGWSGIVYPADNGSAVTVSGSTGLSVSTDRARNLGTDTVAFYADVESVTASVG